MIGNDAPATVRKVDRHESSRQEYQATGSFYQEGEAGGRAGGQEAVLSMPEECVFERNKMQRDLHTNERKEWEGRE